MFAVGLFMGMGEPAPIISKRSCIFFFFGGLEAGVLSRRNLHIRLGMEVLVAFFFVDLRLVCPQGGVAYNGE